MALHISIEYEDFSKWSIWSIHRTLTGNSTPDKRGPGSNDDESGLYNP